MTPLQLWTTGIFDSRLNENTVSDDYGIEWGGPVPSEDSNDSTVNLDDIESPLTDEQTANIRLNLDEHGYSAANCSPLERVRAFQLIKN